MEKDIKKRTFKQVSEKDRIIIEALLKEKKSDSEIAFHLGFDRRTIQREIVRGTILRRTSELADIPMYNAYYANERHKERVSRRGRKPKFAIHSKSLAKAQQKMKKDKYSPDATIAYFKNKNKALGICTKTLYNYIYAGYFSDIAMKKQKRKQNHIRVSYRKPLSKSIEQRPSEANIREPGHWEMDTVVGKGKACLLVLTERCSRYELIFSLAAKTQANVLQAISNLENKYGSNFSNVFKTITCDNGGEFLDDKGLESSTLSPNHKRTQVFFAHPYSSWERGTNEVNNKLIRKFISKGSDISKYSAKQINKIQNWINDYPRRLFAYKTSSEMFFYKE